MRNYLEISTSSKHYLNTVAIIGTKIIYRNYGLINYTRVLNF